MRRRSRSLPGSLRFRITVLTTVVMALALGAAAFAAIRLQETALRDNLDATLRLRANTLEGVIAAGVLPTNLGGDDGEVAGVQVLDGSGRVVASTPNLVGVPPMSPLRPAPGESAVTETRKLPIDDEAFRVLARGVSAPGGTHVVMVAGSLEPIHESSQALTSIALAGVPLLLAAVAGGAWFIVGRALSPVEAIRREVTAISARRLDHRVPEPGVDDEVGRLARTMNEMLERLQRASERQDRFVADAAHELRSPLASLRTQLEVAAGPSDVDRDGALEEVLRMQDLVDGLLLLARSEHQEGPEGELLDLDDVVLEEAARFAHPGGISVDVSGVSAAQIRGDRAALGRAVRNLLDNAVRHAASRVLVNLGERGPDALLEVMDDGPGIDAGERERVFERFARLDRARGRGSGGAGIGLAIVRAIVEAHGGSITAVEPGHLPGARFLVRLPLGLPTG